MTMYNTTVAGGTAARQANANKAHGAASIVTGYFAGKQAEREAYDQAYSAAARRSDAMNRIFAASRRISSIKQDKILSNVDIQMKQNQAEAEAKVAAAFAGVEGGSVDAVIYQTESNAAHRVAETRKKADQSIENELTAAYNAQGVMLSTTEAKSSYMGTFAEGLSSLDRGDIARFGDAHFGTPENDVSDIWAAQEIPTTEMMS